MTLVTKILGFIITSVFLCTVCFANIGPLPYFVLYADRYLLPGDGVVMVHVAYYLAGNASKNFVVTPKISEGLVDIYNVDKDRWLLYGSSDYRSPILDTWYALRITKLNSPTAEVYFEIYDTKTSKNYTTSRIKVWNQDVGKIYLRRLNDGLKSTQGG